MASSSKAGLGAVYLAVFLDSMGTTMIMPLLPFLALQMDASPFEIGCMQSFSSLAQIFGSLILGYLSDLTGRRSILLVCLLCSSASLIALGFAPDIVQLIAFRAISGFFAGTYVHTYVR